MRAGATGLKGVRAKDMPEVILLLKNLGVASWLIARLFDDTPENIRQIQHRARLSEARKPALNPNSIVPWIQHERELYIGYSEATLDKMRAQDKNTRRSADHEQLWDLLRSMVTIRGDSLSFGLCHARRSLRKLVPRVASAKFGFAGNVRGLLDEELARNSLLTGFLEESFKYAQDDLEIARVSVVEELARQPCVRRYGNAAYIASVALYNQRRYQEGHSWARESYAACKPLGPATLVQYPHERRAFRRRRCRELPGMLLRVSSGRKGKHLREFVIAMEQLRIFGNRIGISPTLDAELAAAWSKAKSLLPTVPDYFGNGSVQHVIATNWLAATGIRIGRSEDALELLCTINPDPNEMRYQAILTKLLNITPELRLSDAQLEYWLKYILCDASFPTREVSAA